MKFIFPYIFHQKERTFMIRVICLVIGYFIGCIQTAYVVGRFMGVDIREHGSGNAGATNAIRVLGAKAGLFVFACDILKAMLGYLICSLLFSPDVSFFMGGNVLLGAYAGLGVILGHNFPFYLKFRGGKGIAATMGLALILDARVALICYAIGFGILFISRYVSLGSLIAIVIFPVVMFFFGYGLEVILVMASTTVLAIYQHRKNIKRLLSGTENKFTFKKQRVKS